MKNMASIISSHNNQVLNALGDERLLNKRSEFISKCRHQSKLLYKM